MYTGDPSEKEMTTGRHVVRDILCTECSTTVGWVYVQNPKKDLAYEESQKYKEGRYILERSLVKLN